MFEKPRHRPLTTLVYPTSSTSGLTSNVTDQCHRRTTGLTAAEVPGRASGTWMATGRGPAP